MNLKIFYILAGVVLLSVIGYVVGLIIGMSIGGNYFPDFEFMSGRGYEATGYIGGIIGAIVGMIFGVYFGYKFSNKKNRN